MKKEINMKIVILLSTWLITCYCQNIELLFENIDKSLLNFNSIASEITWISSIDHLNLEQMERATDCQKNKLIWQHSVCERLAALEKQHSLNKIQRRQTYLLCRGPKFTYEEETAISDLLNELQAIYDIFICIPTQKNMTKDHHESTTFLKKTDLTPFAAKMGNIDLEYGLFCLKGEEDFEKMMKSVKDENVLKLLWLAWRQNTGLMKKPFRELVRLENQGARRNGYPDIGVFWRDELEITNLRQLSRQLYSSIRPLYSMLHGVVRYYLRGKYGNSVPEKGPIPAHLLDNCDGDIQPIMEEINAIKTLEKQEMLNSETQYLQKISSMTGDLWSQNWEATMDFITHKSIDLDASIKNLNWTVQHMVKLAEDFYQSMGLPAMTPKFWRESVLEKKNGDTQCHGTAADMFQDDDYRLLYCADTTMEDLYVLHHELGHIHYYMAYANQPVLFRQANSALQESIGDAIFYGVMTPQHLHRLNLVNDTIGYSDSTAKPPEQKLEDVIERNDYHPEKLINNLKVDQMETNQNHKASQKYDIADNFYDISKTNEKQYDKISDSGFSKNNVEAKRIETFGDRIDDTLTMNMKIDKSDLNTVETLDLTPDELLLLKQALNKIPQIPYALVIDEYRWKYFEGGMDMNALNKEFWDLTLELQGIVPPEERDEQYFDVAAKFHVPDNTAYIRYFLSSFIQHQIFEALCRAAVFGRRDMTTPLPDTIIMNRCDIYGSKAAGKLLKDFMSRGHSQHWREILFATTGNTDITPLALQRYYRPLYNILERTVKKLNIPLGW